MKTNEQKKSILSIEDKAIEYSKTLVGIDVHAKKDFIAGANEMLPIIKELGEALKEIQEANTGGVINTHWMQNHIQTTLDKYKQYL